MLRIHERTRTLCPLTYWPHPGPLEKKGTSFFAGWGSRYFSLSHKCVPRHRGSRHPAGLLSSRSGSWRCPACRRPEAGRPRACRRGSSSALLSYYAAAPQANGPAPAPLGEIAVARPPARPPAAARATAAARVSARASQPPPPRGDVEAAAEPADSGGNAERHAETDCAQRPTGSSLAPCRAAPPVHAHSLAGERRRRRGCAHPGTRAAALAPDVPSQGAGGIA
jgi:hypothetical protein